MALRPHPAAALRAAILLSASNGLLAAGEKSDWRELHRLIAPDAAELAWETKVPWLTDLWEARRQAAAAGKPIFLWEMDGHPLGCT